MQQAGSKPRLKEKLIALLDISIRVLNYFLLSFERSLVIIAHLSPRKEPSKSEKWAIRNSCSQMWNTCKAMLQNINNHYYIKLLQSTRVNIFFLSFYFALSSLEDLTDMLATPNDSYHSSLSVMKLHFDLCFPLFLWLLSLCKIKLFVSISCFKLDL